jgi:hypothetical protein
MKKLTSAQIEKLSIALAAQFNGNVIALGSTFTYIDGKVYIGKHKHIRENNNVVFDDKREIGTKSFGNVLKNTGCLQREDVGYNRYYNVFSINVSKIMEYSNGQDVINNAIKNISK